MVLSDRSDLVLGRDGQDFQTRRKDFPSLSRLLGGQPLCYFDGPGGTQVPNCVIEAISDYYRSCNANVHGQFVTSAESDRLLEQARQTVATFLNAPSEKDISFGANMTTLNFMLSRAVVRCLEPADEILITQLDHEGNRGPWLGLRREGIIVREVVMRQDGTLDYDDFRRKLGEKTRLVAMGWASNALGTINDLRLVREATRRLGIWLLVDAVHYAPHFPVDVQDLGCDFLLCSAYKFYGPHVGILYCRTGLLGKLPTQRLITQSPEAPYRVETGTLNHACIAGVKAAIEYIGSYGEGQTLREQVITAMSRISSHEHRLAAYLYSHLLQRSAVTLYGPPVGIEPRAPTVSFTVAGASPQAVARRLGEKGILVWDGDFYAARAVEVLGLADSGGLIRVGMSLYNTTAELDRLLGELDRVIEEK